MIRDADSVIGVIFTGGGGHGDALQLWQSIWGDTPDQFNRTANNPTSPTTASGTRRGYSVRIASYINRIDVVLSAADAPISSVMPRIVEVKGAVWFLQELMLNLGRPLNPARCAVVLDLAQTVEPSDASDAFRSLVPQATFPLNSIDTIYQFNVRRVFNAFGFLSMNRLISYGTGSAGMAEIQMIPDTPQKIEMRPFVSLKIDVNSAPESRIPPGFYETVLRELTDEALAIYSNPQARFA